MQEKIEFKADGLFLKQFKSKPDEFEITLSTGIYEYDNIKDIPKYPKGVYKVTIEPVIEE